MNINFTIPGKPLSTNHMYGQHGKRRFMYKEGKEYKEKVIKIVKELNPKLLESNDLSIHIKYYFPDNRRRDCSNYEKGLLDALSGLLYKDDSQLQRVILEKFIDKDNARTEVKLNHRLHMKMTIKFKNV
jgi:crossover junction endodeoxyribonuclease RusA